MAFATLTYSSLDGATDQFDVTFPYISASDVKVFLNGSATTAFSFLTTSRIQMNSMPASGSTLIVKRATSQTSRLVDYQTGGILSEDVLDTDSLQAFYMAQEAIDTTDATIQIDNATAQWTAENLRITNLTTPTSAQDAATKAYADTQSALAAGSASAASTSAAAALVSENAAAADLVLTNADTVSTAAHVVSAAAEAAAAVVSAASAAASAAGIYWKAPVLVSSTANLTLSGAQTIDGISAVAGDRILVKDQTAPAENGIYIVAAGAWSRAVPMDTWDEHVGAVVLVSQGSIGENKAYQCTVNAGGTLGTTAITWASFGAVAIDFVVDTFVDVTNYTSGTTTALTLSAEAGSEQNITVTFDGVTQHHNEFSLSGTTLTFSEAIPLGVESVEVKLGSSLGIGTPSDGTVTEAKIATGAVTEAKIATSAVTVTKIADDAITLAKMAGGTDGNLITYDANGDPAYVATGTVGQVLTSGGAGVAPTMQDAAGGGLIFLDKTVTSGTPTTVEWTDIGTTYDTMYFVISNLTRATGTNSYAQGFQVGYGATPTWITTNGYDAIAHRGYDGVSPVSMDLRGGDDSGDFIRIGNSRTSGEATNATFTITNLLNTSVPAGFLGHSHTNYSGSMYQHIIAGQVLSDTNAVTAIRLMQDTGNLGNGCTILRYGMTQA